MLITLAALPFLSITVVASVIILFVILSFTFTVLKKASIIQHEMESGTEKFFKTIYKQVEKDHEGSVELPKNIIPGVDEVRIVKVSRNSMCNGKTLVEFNLRVLTGATVIAIVRHKKKVYPISTEVLREGDVLTIVGGHTALEQAMELLTHSPA